MQPNAAARTAGRTQARLLPDFDDNGNVRKTRMPIGRPIVIELNGNQWYGVFKGLYTLMV